MALKAAVLSPANALRDPSGSNNGSRTATILAVSPFAVTSGPAGRCLAAEASTFAQGNGLPIYLPEQLFFPPWFLVQGDRPASFSGTPRFL
jgi:hypothetical protein